jgi:hypothetical protein
VTIRCLRSLIMTNLTKLVPNLSHIFRVLVTLFQWKRPRTQQCDHMPPTVAGLLVRHNEKNVCDYRHIVTLFWRDQYNFLYQWVLRGFLLHHFLINNSASLRNGFGEFYFSPKLGILGLLHQWSLHIAYTRVGNDSHRESLQ